MIRLNSLSLIYQEMKFLILTEPKKKNPNSLKININTIIQGRFKANWDAFFLYKCEYTKYMNVFLLSLYMWKALKSR